MRMIRIFTYEYDTNEKYGSNYGFNKSGGLLGIDTSYNLNLGLVEIGGLVQV